MFYVISTNVPVMCQGILETTLFQLLDIEKNAGDDGSILILCSKQISEYDDTLQGFVVSIGCVENTFLLVCL